MKYTLITIIALNIASTSLATEPSHVAVLTLQKKLDKTDHKSKPTYHESNPQKKSSFWIKKNKKNRSCKLAQARKSKASKQVWD
jgi:hypothetical protein